MTQTARASAWAASSQKKTPADAVIEVGARLRALGFDASSGADASALVFASAPLAADPEALSASLADVLGDVPFLGFVGGSAFHDVRLRERKGGLAVLVLPGVRGVVRAAPLDHEEPDAALLADLPRGDVRFVSFAADAPIGARVDIVRALHADGVPLVGGFGAAGPSARPIVFSRGASRPPCAGVIDLGGVRAVLGVAQAARALGPTRTVTAVSEQHVLEIDGRPAVDVLVDDLPPALRARMTALGPMLCAGIATEDGESTLVKAVTSVDRERGAVGVAGSPRVGSELVFSLRDGRAARDDLDELLRALKEALGKRRPRAFVLLSSSARDEELFGAPCFDAQALLARFGTDIPVVGCSTAGELCTYGPDAHQFSTSAVIAALL